MLQSLLQLKVDDNLMKYKYGRENYFPFVEYAHSLSNLMVEKKIFNLAAKFLFRGINLDIYGTHLHLYRGNNCGIKTWFYIAYTLCYVSSSICQIAKYVFNVLRPWPWPWPYENVFRKVEARLLKNIPIHNNVSGFKYARAFYVRNITRQPKKKVPR